LIRSLNPPRLCAAASERESAQHAGAITLDGYTQCARETKRDLGQAEPVAGCISA